MSPYQLNAYQSEPVTRRFPLYPFTLIHTDSQAGVPPEFREHRRQSQAPRCRHQLLPARRQMPGAPERRRAERRPAVSRTAGRARTVAPAHAGAQPAAQQRQTPPLADQRALNRRRDENCFRAQLRAPEPTPSTDEAEDRRLVDRDARRREDADVVADDPAALPAPPLRTRLHSQPARRSGDAKASARRSAPTTWTTSPTRHAAVSATRSPASGARPPSASRGASRTLRRRRTRAIELRQHLRAVTRIVDRGGPPTRHLTHTTSECTFRTPARTHATRPTSSTTRQADDLHRPRTDLAGLILRDRGGVWTRTKSATDGGAG